jgi:hypothetical protein
MHTIPIKNHAAIAIPITGLFDRIWVDCILGLPVDGFKGILIMIDAFSKLILLHPIAGKEAEDIYQGLIHWISLYGPPKIIKLRTEELNL